MKDLKLGKIKLAEIRSALETGLCTGAVFVHPEIPIGTVARLHSSKRTADGVELARLIISGKICCAFSKQELKKTIPEELEGIKEKDMYFVHWDKNSCK